MVRSAIVEEGQFVGRKKGEGASAGAGWRKASGTSSNSVGTSTTTSMSSRSRAARIVDINNLVANDSSDDDSSDDGVDGGSRIDRYGPKKPDAGRSGDANETTSLRDPKARSRMWTVVAIMLVVIVTVAATVGIVVLAIPGGDGASEAGNSDNTSESERAMLSYEEQLNVAEDVVIACEEEQLNNNMSICQDLCHDKMCCFEENGDYNCADDESKYCAVHAACEALVTVIPIDIAENALTPDTD